MKIVEPISHAIAVSLYGDTEEEQLRAYRDTFEYGFYLFVLFVYGFGLFGVFELGLYILLGRPMVYSAEFHGYTLMGTGTLFTLSGSLVPEHWKDKSTSPRLKASVHIGLMIFVSGLLVGIPTGNESIQNMYDKLFDGAQGIQELSVNIFVFVISVILPFVLIGLFVWSVWRWSQNNDVEPLNAVE